MVNFGLLAAEIVSLVSGTPATFNGFHVLAALLHGSQVVSISQTLQRWTEGATYESKMTHFESSGMHNVNQSTSMFLPKKWMDLKTVSYYAV